MLEGDTMLEKDTLFEASRIPEALVPVYNKEKRQRKEY